MDPLRHDARHRLRFAAVRLLIAAVAGGLLPGCLESTGPSAPAKRTVTAPPQEAEPLPVRSAPAMAATSTPLPAGTLPAAELADGWCSLFDGQTLFGWVAGSRADWRVEEGTIVVSSGEKGLLCTTAPFANFVLRLEFSADPQTNSGIFLRTPLRPRDPKSDCYELNIAPADNPFPTGSFVGRQRVELDTSGSGWRSYEITVDGPRSVVKLDGKQVLDYVDPTPLKAGLIGLQLNEGRVAFRNLRIKPLGLRPIFDGKSLDGWTTYPDMPSRFRVTPEGWLNVRNGRGQLETRQQYGDFVLQFEVLTNAPNLNSGVFFRCIPGQQMNGYECQIHHGFVEGNRTAPADYGTGAIFRRQPARVVAANDGEWAALTLVASGAHMSVWVNGLQVTDWTDDRPPHENPRNGLRLEPGTIMLQGHDPTTDVSFRNLRIVESP